MKESTPLQALAPPAFPELDALLRLQGRLLHVSRLATVGEMSTGIAHELNQPLCAIANYAQASERLLAGPDPDLAEVRDALQAIADQALRAGEVIRHLRGLARPQQAQPQPMEINHLVLELADLIQSDAKHNRVRYRFEAGLGLPRVCVDGAQIQQLLLNLVRNAIEALASLPPESREVLVRTFRNSAGEIQVTVSDLGPGIAPSIAPYLFTPFCTSKANGTGLGLAMSRTIANSHGGELEYHPNSPSGACFTLTLPAAQAGVSEH
jgi:C4-dicarboxylate-specific signal transduction histidine kinase